jgi:bacteriorhodopsin
MLIGTICFAAAGLYHADQNSVTVLRTTPFMSASITLISSVSYLLLATGHGLFAACPDHRPVQYARYIEWLISTPVMLVMLSTVGALTADTCCFLVFLDLVMVLSGLTGAMILGPARWVFFSFGVICLLPILGVLFHSWESWKKAGLQNHPSASAYQNALAILMITWVLYGVMWVLTDGTSAVCRDTEAALYLALDVIAKIVFCRVLNSGYTGSFSASPLKPMALGQGFSSMI